MLIQRAGIYQVDSEQVEIDTSGEVVLQIKTTNINIQVLAKNDLKLNLMMQNSQAIDCQITCKVTGRLSIGVIALLSDKINCTLNSELLAVKANIQIVSVAICEHQQSWVYQIKHLAKDTYSDVQNYGIISLNGLYDCEIIGSIDKGCKGSEVYQSSRVLTNGNVKNVRVLPILKMAENDIQAKHACSIGQLDQQQRHYLLSRGLDDKAIVQLVAYGYLSNVLKLIEEPTILKTVELEIQRQVNNLCSM